MKIYNQTDQTIGVDYLAEKLADLDGQADPDDNVLLNSWIDPGGSTTIDDDCIIALV